MDKLVNLLCQQLSNVAVRGTNERRYFTGVQGENDGELFGIENLFSLRSKGASLAHDIVKRTEKIEAGFRVANYNVVLPMSDEPNREEYEVIEVLILGKILTFLMLVPQTM